MIVTETIELLTKGHGDIIDLTPRIQQILGNSTLNCGIVTVFITGSTAGVTTIEYEPNLVVDFQRVWDNIVPSGKSYRHDRTWGDANGYAHLRASMLGASLVVPFRGAQLTLGTWQQVILVDFDNRQRTRQVVVQVIGE